MFPLIKFIGLFNRGKNTNVSFYVSLVSIIVGLFALNSLDMFSSGFKKQIIDKLSYLDGHLKIKKIGSNISYNEYIDINDKLNDSYQVFPYIKKNIILRKNRDIKSMILISISHEYLNNSNEITFDLIDSLGSNSIILSHSLLDKLDLGINDKCNIYDLDLNNFNDLTPVKSLISGSFNSDFKEYDEKVGFIPMANIENKKFSGILVNTSDPMKSNSDINTISKILNNNDYRYISWKTQHSSFIDWLDLFHIPIKIIIFMITMVSSFSITTSLYLFLDDKKYHISLFRSIGYSSQRVKLILFKVVLLLSSIGLILGNSLTIILYLIQKEYGFITLPSDVYFMSTLPVNFSLYHFVQNNVLIITMILGFSIYPIINTKKIIPTNLRKYELV